MDKKKEEMLEKLRNVKAMENNNLSINRLEDEVQIEDVKFVGQATIIEEIEGEKVEKEINVYAVLEGKNIKYYSDDMCLGYETEGVGIIPSPEYQKKYEENSPIKDVVENLKEKEMSGQEKPQEEKTVQSLEKLEEEKMEEYADIAGIDKKDVKKVAEIKEGLEEKEQEKVDERKLESVSHLQEIKGTNKVNNHETISKAIGLEGVKKFVVIYSEDTEKIARNNGEEKNRNNSRYSIIAVMNDGNAINIDNKLELSRSEGANSTEGRIQTNADGTTQKEYKQASIYNIKGKDKAISIEKDQYGEIQVYYGGMTKGSYGNEGNQFVGTQLETDNVWPTSRDVREQECNKEGIYHTDEKAEEANKHFEHGDEEIENIKNADGKEETKELCENQINMNLVERYVEEILENESINDTYTKKEVREYLLETIQKNPNKEPEEIKETVEYDLDMTARERKL